jgi:hypothetical protein
MVGVDVGGVPTVRVGVKLGGTGDPVTVGVCVAVGALGSTHTAPSLAPAAGIRWPFGSLRITLLTVTADSSALTVAEHVYRSEPSGIGSVFSREITTARTA